MKSIARTLQILLPITLIACSNKPVDDDGDGYLNTEECDDTNPAIAPNATDMVGDGIDQNCDGIDGTDGDGDAVASVASGGDDCDDENADLTGKFSYYQDSDADGFGNPESETEACEAPAGFVEDNTDCDDHDYTVHPEAQEVCDGGIDNDCDGAADDSDDSVEGQINVYEDGDADGFGDPTTETLSCALTASQVTDGTDCNDTDSAIHPDAQEILGDSIDNDCDAQELCYEDLDGDGFGSQNLIYLATDLDGFSSCDDDINASSLWTDCDDDDATIHPDAQEICDEIDNDCDSLVDDDDTSVDLSTGSNFYADLDQDGFGAENTPIQACKISPTLSTIIGDCDDSLASTHPLATDILGDGTDQNCDGIDGTDVDQDGFASVQSGGDDCDDNNELINTAAQEECDGVDQDCNGFVDDNPLDGNSYYYDMDGDGFGDPTNSAPACSETVVLISDNTDCDDHDVRTYPGAAHLDSATECLTDRDGDGFGDINSNHTSSSATDCNDSNSGINILSNDLVGDSYDQNCDGIDGIDVDLDGFASLISGGDDCDDSDSTISNNTDFDQDGYTCANDCNDYDATIHPNAQDRVGDGIDQDCDGDDTAQAPLFADISNPNDQTLALICNSYNVIYGDLTIDMINLASNSTKTLSCLTSIYGNLTINNINSSSEISFPNLHIAEDITLNGGVSYDFSALTEADNISISSNQSLTFDGDISFPSLTTINERLSWEFGLSSDIIGFTSLISLGSLEIIDDLSLKDVTGFLGITTLEELILNNTYLTDFSGGSLTEISIIEIRNNDFLEYTTGLQSLSSTSILDIRNDDALLEDGCMYYTDDTNILISRVTYNGFDVGSCDLDGDGYSLDDGDCDDQDSSLELSDSDSDGFTTCEGDCNDFDSAINPAATEIWYDGIDQNCDGANDFDQDGDTDDGLLFGGTDCNDTDITLNGLDLDDDGTSSCDGDNIEPIESCLEWYDAGIQNNGIYPLIFANGSSFEVYCDMNTAGGGWTLFAVTNSTNCTEDLSYGQNELLNFQNPYFSLIASDVEHTEFMQDMRSDGLNTDFTIVWNFLDGASNLENRFINAYRSGTVVQWTVHFNNSEYGYTGSWWFSDSAFTGWNNPWSQGSGNSFSQDDGIWGAANGTVNGNTNALPIWGQAISNSNDNDCDQVYLNGTAYQSNQILNLLYFR